MISESVMKALEQARPQGISFSQMAMRLLLKEVPLEEIAKLNKTQYGKPLDLEWFFEGKKKLVPVDVAAMVTRNRETMAALLLEIIADIPDAGLRTLE